jgi:hypothetical protein
MERRVGEDGMGRGGEGSRWGRLEWSLDSVARVNSNSAAVGMASRLVREFYPCAHYLYSPSASAHSPVPRLHAPRPQTVAGSFSPPHSSAPTRSGSRPPEAATFTPAPCRAPPPPFSRSGEIQAGARCREGEAGHGRRGGRAGPPRRRASRGWRRPSPAHETLLRPAPPISALLYGHGPPLPHLPEVEVDGPDSRLAAVRRRRRQDPGAVRRPLLLFLFEAASICATAVTRGQRLPFSCARRPSLVADLVSIFIPYSNPIYFFVSF